MKQRPYIVPDGYFQQLESSLKTIPQSGARNFRIPAFAYASFAVVVSAVIAGFFFFRTQRFGDYEVTYERMAYADLIPNTDDLFAYEETPDSEDLIQYMIHEGYTLESFVEP